MKTKKILLTVLLLGAITYKSSAQQWPSNIYNGINSPPAILGTANNYAIDFGTNSMTQMVLETTGDLNMYNAGNGYQINNNPVLYLPGSSSSNIAVGYNTIGGTSADNTFVGYLAGSSNTGSENTYLGYEAGSGFNASISGSDITCIGYKTGYNAITATSDNMYFGDNSVTQLNASTAAASAGITGYSDRRIKDNIRENVPGLAFINRLHPVTFHVNLHKENELSGIKDEKEQPGEYEVEKMTISGFIAQQVDSVAQVCGYDFCGLKKPSNSKELYRLGYTAFIMPLVKAAQELSVEDDSLGNVIQNMQTCIKQLCEATGENAPTPLLRQNAPNPFNSSTQINYYLPEGTAGASIVFYDRYGNPIKTVQLNQTGNGTLNITSDNLGNGIYSYTLMLNGSTINTKQMLLQH